MKRILSVALFCLILASIHAQEAIIYYEGGIILYVCDQYAYEFQSLLDDRYAVGITTEIKDSTFLAFLDNKIESAKECIQEGECFDATYKPSAMIQIV